MEGESWMVPLPIQCEGQSLQAMTGTKICPVWIYFWLQHEHRVIQARGN
jgi:hypothetical protein